MDDRTNKKWAEILQYAKEHATGEGNHIGYKWLQDAFEDYRAAIGAPEINPDDIGFEMDELMENINKEPWVTEIARKPAPERPSDYSCLIVEEFLHKYWLGKLDEFTTKDVADVLKVAAWHHDRVTLAGKIANELRYNRDEHGHVSLGLTDEQLNKLTDTLQHIVEHPKNEQSLKIK